MAETTSEDIKGAALPTPLDAVSETSTSNPVTETYIDPALEKKLMSKFDLFVLPQLGLFNIIGQLDRSNIGNAKQFGFEKGLGLVGTQFNDISSMFYATYVLFEIAWVLALKRWGANKVLAIAIIGWSVITIGTGFIHNYHQLIAMRLLLGVFEAGLFPCCAFIISTIWTPQHQSKRIAVLYSANAISGAFGGLIAFGIQSHGKRGGLDAWRWLFIAEGIMSLGIGFIMYITLPRDVENAWFLNKQERALMRACKQRDIAYKGDTTFSWVYVKQALTDPFLWIASFSMFCSSIPLFGFGIFLPTIIKGLGFTSLQANYLTIPVYTFGLLALYCATFTSDKLNKRAQVAVFAPFPVMIGYAIIIGSANKAAGYFAMFMVITGLYTYNTLTVTWVSNNLKGDHKRSFGIPMLISIANTSGLVALQLYTPGDLPRYITGNAVSLSTEFLALMGLCTNFILIRHRNKKAVQETEGSGKREGFVV